MKRTLAIALFTAASVANIATASAQDHGVQATVPFDFTVGGKLLPADTYRVTQPLAGVVTVQSMDHKHTASAVIQRGPTETYDGRSKLVFSKYGGQYFLHNVLSTSAGMNAALPTSGVEQSVRRELVKLVTREEVQVAAK